ncbi:MAG: DNA mismatch repair endonuclease MutL [Alphaproteobacteria bacterium]
MTIRRLPKNLVNQIAAGEIIERPFAVVKELVENAIDAGASQIDVLMIDGGKSRICITDNGKGMTKDELSIALERHATSKLPADDLSNISTLGFRGEALPSIGSISHFSITSKAATADDAWQIEVVAGEIAEPVPAALDEGTVMDVRNLFFATPVRLKFLKTEQTEFSYAVDAINKLAMTYPHIGFTLDNGKRLAINVSASTQETRLSEILGEDFIANSIQITAEKDGMTLRGYAGLPTLHRTNARAQYFIVNNRPVKDKILYASVKASYRDFMPHDRYPVIVLFLDLPADTLDVNVHPAKTEIRFRDPVGIRNFIVASLKNTLREGAQRTATTLSGAALRVFNPPTPFPSNDSLRETSHSYRTLPAFHHTNVSDQDFVNPIKSSQFSEKTIGQMADIFDEDDDQINAPLGFAKAQIHESYIIAQTEDGIVLVDQHAAHERLLYEKFKNELAEGLIKRQNLLMPEVVELEEAAVAALLSKQKDLFNAGIEIEAFGAEGVVVRTLPTILDKEDAKQLMRDIADEMIEIGSTDLVEEKMNEVLATRACHYSVRSGRLLNRDEMNALLRQMEETPFSGQCNHGRPTYIELKLSDIEKLFERT